jgi:hypothetical protein
MDWREYHELTKHSVESLRGTQHYLDWANMPNPFAIDVLFRCAIQAGLDRIFPD